ncbi:hypothetical protein FRC04_010884 [Tulasnella sp. 424]|nr:hypothetical protein FRC04_010884 [Tulasnella sp. 424]KAG8972038.1 hypothetical protein FRC05_010451 [Tulasnella sp. 425]
MSAAAAAPAWKQFPFFDVVPVKDAHDLGSSPEIFKNVPELSTIASTSAGILVADIHGSIHLLGQDFVPKHSWVAHLHGRVTHMSESRGILVSLGEEEKFRTPLLKIWDLDHFDKKTGSPILLRSTKLQVGNKPHPVSAMALSSSLSHLAIGFGDGSVQLYRHLDQSLFSGNNSLTAVPKPKVVHEAPTEPVTGLGFREPRVSKENGEKNDAVLYLYIATTNRVLAYIASGRGSGNTPTVVDEVGSGLGCCSMYARTQEMAVARDEAIYMCGPEGRGACYAYEGPKSYLYCFKTYVIIVSPPFFPKPSNISATVRNYVARAPEPALVSQQDISKITVIDVENKFVAYSGPVKEGVREVMFRGDEIYVLANDGQLSYLEEKPTSVKLETLFRQSRFTLAISVARTAGVDESGIADIHRQYGDHLYAKGDDDGAMQQYVRTIGYLQPSYVIRKFLDAKRINNLTLFLQELHARSLANADHTTLLLNTYTKLKDIDRLDTFIKTESHKGDGQEPPFDLDTAIRVCRQAGYFEHASYLAKKYKRHEDYLRIQIEDAGSYQEALAYVKELGPETAEVNLARYGRAMLANLPNETTQVLIELCSGTGFANTPETEDRPASPAPLPGDRTPSGHQRQATIRRSYHDGDSSRASSPPPSQTILTSRRPPRRRPSPRQYFAHFVNHVDLFMRFLEELAQIRWGQKLPTGATPATQPTTKPIQLSDTPDELDRADQVAVWNTLLELYLTRSGQTQDTSASTALRNKAVAVLRDDVAFPYDQSHALLICSTYGFTDGLIILWEKMGMYEDILRFWMEKENSQPNTDLGNGKRASDEVLRHLGVYGPAHPHLYPMVLRFLTSSAALLSRHTMDVMGILEKIDKDKIIPPLGVVQILSRNDVASVGLVKDWLMRRIKDSRGEISADRETISAYRKDTMTKLQEVAELSDPTNPRVFHVTRCSSCSGPLDLPAVHFMCKHSYHQRCLGEHETECPNCAQAHGLVKEIKRDNEAFMQQQDLFLANVQESGFEAIAEGFSKGLLGPKVEVVPLT